MILGAGLCTTCRGERLLVVIRFSATFLPLSLSPFYEKLCTSFLNDAESLTGSATMVARFDAVSLFIVFVPIL